MKLLISNYGDDFLMCDYNTTTIIRHNKKEMDSILTKNTINGIIEEFNKLKMKKNAEAWICLGDLTTNLGKKDMDLEKSYLINTGELYSSHKYLDLEELGLNDLYSRLDKLGVMNIEFAVDKNKVPVVVSMAKANRITLTNLDDNLKEVLNLIISKVDIDKGVVFNYVAVHGLKQRSTIR